MATVIYPATLADLDLIEQWAHALYKVERVFEPHMRYFGEHYRERDVAQLSSPDALYLIADFQNQPAGYLAASVVDMPEHLTLSGQECVIEVVYLEAFARGKGVVDELLKACFVWAREKAVKRFRAGIYADNGASLKLFKRLGLQPHHVTLLKALD